jgi:hypothetical protein
MSIDTNAPSEIVTLGDMILLCPEASRIGLDNTRLYFPSATIDPDAGSASSLPLIVLAGSPLTRTQYATQTLGLPAGEITATLYGLADAGKLANHVRTLAGELLTRPAGLPITAISIEDPTDPLPGMRADNPVYSATITITWGLQP